MPYKIQKADGKYQVVNAETGKVHGTHDTRDKALAQMRALYANVPDAEKKDIKLFIVDNLEALLPDEPEAQPEPEPEPEETKAIAEVKEPEPEDTVLKKSLDLSYIKALGLEIPEKDLAVKYVSKDTIRHPVFLWGDPGKTDLEGEYFTRETDFWDEALGKSTRPLTWDHAQDGTFNDEPLIGKTVEWEDDEIGRWAISVLDKGHRYRNAIDKLIKAKSLGSASIAIPLLGASSDSAPQYVKRVKVGKAVWLERWPWFATALTPAPCEPRMIGLDGKGVEFLKSLGIEFPETLPEAWEEETAIIDYFKIKYQIGD